MQLRKYDRYKPSGVEWLGEIPEQWEIKPGFTVINERKEKNKGLKEKTILSLSYGDVIIKPEEKLTGLVPESFETYQLVYPGDIIIRPTDLQNDKTSLRTGQAKTKGIITSAYINLRVIEKYSKGYYKYFLHIVDISKKIYELGSGLRQNISFLDFKRFLFVVPSLAEQTAIANFLDEKTAKIDQAIAIKQKQIELLKEHRQILIHKAVTRGLNPNAKLKDSGAEWIGEIPEHWEVKRLKYLLGERNERSIDGNETLFMMSQVHGLVKRSEYHEKAEVAQSAIGNKLVYENDLVFNKLKAHLGVFYKSIIPEVGMVSPDYAVYFSKGKIDDLKYLEFLFRTPEYIKEFNCRATGIVEGLIRLYTKDLFEISIPVPPSNEQIKILNFIENLSIKIRKSLTLKEQEIEKLKEYKAVLINSAVTGKIRVE